MTRRSVHALGAAIIAAGALLGVTAALWAGRPGPLWRALAIGLFSYVASGALVLHWGREVYGPAGALGAAALFAFTPGALAALGAPTLIAPAGGTTLAGGLAQLAAAYTLMRCLLDPTLQLAGATGLIILALPVGAFLHGASSTVLLGFAALSVALIVCRTLSAERCEARARVARSSVASVGLAWTVTLVVFAAIAALSHFPAAEEYSALGVPARIAFDAPPAASSWLAVVPLAALALAAVRPWRRVRRFSDSGWIAALLCLGVPLWLAWGEPGGVFMAPFAALLAGACWDRGGPAWRRRAAQLVVVLQIAAALLLWPRYPGGVRADAWLPMPGVSIGTSEDAR